MGIADVKPDKAPYDLVPAYLSFSCLLYMPFISSLMPLFLHYLPILLFSVFSHSWVVFSFNSPLKCHLSRSPVKPATQSLSQFLIKEHCGALITICGIFFLYVCFFLLYLVLSDTK